MLSVAWHTLRARWAAFVGSFVALALGVALLTVMGQALAASLDAPARAPERFAAAPVVVAGQDTLRVATATGERTKRLDRPRPVPAGTVAALRALGPVTEDRSFPVRAYGSPAAPDDLVGHPWSTARFAPYRLTAGRAPAAADEVATSGDWATVGTRLRTADGPLRVVGTVVRAPGPGPASGPGREPEPAEPERGVEHAVFYQDARAARLGPESTQLVVEADTAAVRAAVTDEDVRVLTGDARRSADADPDRDAEALTALNALFGTAGGVSAFVSVFVVASTFAFAVDRRRREFGLLRTAGATPGQIRRSVLAEALLVGTLASAAGCVLGGFGAPFLTEVVVDGGLAPDRYAIGGPSAGYWPYHLAFWTGLLVALCGALAASWRAGRTAPAQALREASVDGRALTRGRRVCGTALLLAAVATLAYTLVTDPGELLHRKSYISRPMLLITAVALLSPLMVRPLVPRLPGAVGLLARAGAVAAVRRTAAVAAPVLVTVALAGSLPGATATIGAARAAETEQRTIADFVVTPRDGTALRATAVEELRRVPGAIVSAGSATSVFTLEDGVALVKSGARAADPAALAATVRLPVTAGRLGDLDDGSIVVTEEWARHRVGQRVRVWLGDGTPKTLRIAAVLAVGTGDDGAYVTPANAGGAGVDRVDVRVRAGADATAVAARLRTVDGARVTSRTQWVRAARPETNRTTRLGMLLVLGVALLYTGISLANTLAMAAAERRPELTALRLAGATSGQILRLAATEALTAVAIGALLGLLVTVVDLTGLSAALHLLSAPPAIAPPWQALAWTTAACALLATVTAVTSTTPSLRPPRP
ncbi:putative ABC transport system permease protein [Streptomyces sp. 3330]|uniref:ABC transporter permease n=1 Tax=Streptomyces sp. 3330 TaxID=2817755 RepID=UPI00285FD172|nr:FtsX-like permease family protein [Streptomyces sp. 3330]MDR6974844.1 putative ABC transport system permease protein [Streptomyces sp. 3330]